MFLHSISKTSKLLQSQSFRQSRPSIKKVTFGTKLPDRIPDPTLLSSPPQTVEELASHLHQLLSYAKRIRLISKDPTWGDIIECYECIVAHLANFVHKEQDVQPSAEYEHDDLADTMEAEKLLVEALQVKSNLLDQTLESLKEELRQKEEEEKTLEIGSLTSNLNQLTVSENNEKELVKYKSMLELKKKELENFETSIHELEKLRDIKETRLEKIHTMISHCWTAVHMDASLKKEDIEELEQTIQQQLEDFIDSIQLYLDTRDSYDLVRDIWNGLILTVSQRNEKDYPKDKCPSQEAILLCKLLGYLAEKPTHEESMESVICNLTSVLQSRGNAITMVRGWIEKSLIMLVGQKVCLPLEFQSDLKENEGLLLV